MRGRWSLGGALLACGAFAQSPDPATNPAHAPLKTAPAAKAPAKQNLLRDFCRGDIEPAMCGHTNRFPQLKQNASNFIYSELREQFGSTGGEAKPILEAVAQLEGRLPSTRLGELMPALQTELAASGLAPAAQKTLLKRLKSAQLVDAADLLREIPAYQLEDFHYGYFQRSCGRYGEEISAFAAQEKGYNFIYLCPGLRVFAKELARSESPAAATAFLANAVAHEAGHFIDSQHAPTGTYRAFEDCLRKHNPGYAEEPFLRELVADLWSTRYLARHLLNVPKGEARWQEFVGAAALFCPRHEPPPRPLGNSLMDQFQKLYQQVFPPQPPPKSDHPSDSFRLVEMYGRPKALRQALGCAAPAAHGAAGGSPAGACGMGGEESP